MRLRDLLRSFQGQLLGQCFGGICRDAFHVVSVTCETIPQHVNKTRSVNRMTEPLLGTNLCAVFKANKVGCVGLGKMDRVGCYVEET